MTWDAAASLSFAATVLLLFAFARRRLRQTGLRHLPSPPNGSFFTGNFTQMFRFDAAQFHEHINRTYGRVIRITGVFGESRLVISDTTAVSRILVKDRHVFEEADWFLASNHRIVGPGILSTKSAQHRRQRKMLHPVFSIKHMRVLTPLFHRVARQLDAALQEKVGDGPQEVQILDWLARLALELIAQGGLGYSFDALNPDRGVHDFDAALKEYMPTVSRLYFLRTLAHLIPNWPAWLLRGLAKALPIPMLHKIVKISDVAHKHSVQIFEEKLTLLAQGDDPVMGEDLITVFMRENMKAPGKDRLTDEEIIAQMTTLLIAATETTSSAVARILHVLAHNPDAQERLRREFHDAGGGDLDYTSLHSLPYLDAVCRETLRLYPPNKFIPRVCQADTSIPLSKPIETSRGEVSSLYIPRGTNLLVNVAGVQHDPDIWGMDADVWKPDRFLEPFPESVTKARIPGVYANSLVFSGGRRACIGFKFAQLEIKVALLHLVRAYRITPSKTEVVWRYGGVTTPSAKGSDGAGMEMPIVLERI
ncbi:cytochrome P450 [Artomyces pyxidatus]|uniref:Cytochrome P450 n=1 Tax=Artomyces pyxidatus TaxID=48021 RepID=A0ACB8ST62_9AGAM|nr:cytochrome P450 [Artomyces pyxidatus]